MDMIQAIMATGAVLVGLTFVGLLLQVAYHAKTERMARQLDHIEAMLNHVQYILHKTQNPPLPTLEELIQKDLMSQMEDPDLVAPTFEELQDILTKVKGINS